MFDFFKKPLKNHDNEKQEDNILASITFFVLDKNQTPYIDVSMSDYSHKAIDAMCALFNVVTSEIGYLEAINMLKNGLIKSGNEDILIQILTSIEPNIAKKLLESKDKDKEPCIRPSDML